MRDTWGGDIEQFCRSAMIFADCPLTLQILRGLGVADFHRKPQILAGNCRFSHETADFGRTSFSLLVVAPLGLLQFVRDSLQSRGRVLGGSPSEI